MSEDKDTGEVAVGPGTPGQPTVEDRPLTFPYLYAFVAGGSLLVLELVAGRILAPTLGVSLYTWTSVIGVVLAGIALGNYAGGRIADRYPNRLTLSVLFFLSAAASALVLALASDLESLEVPTDWPALLRTVWLTGLVFFLPSTLLGTITPMLAKLSLLSLDATGRVVGRLQAAATVGSILGTFATGFFLISWFGTREIVGGVSAMLLLLGILSMGRPRLPLLSVSALAGAFLAAMWITSADNCLRESDYYCIRVESRGSTTLALVLDRNVHGIVDLKDPARLIAPYEQMMQQSLEARFEAGVDIDAFAIGGGTYSFPRYWIDRYEGEVLVAEIDPEVTDVARTYFGLSDDPRIRIEHEDARIVARKLHSDERFDVAFADAFRDSTVPYQLTTREFNDMIARHLKPDGLYFASLADGHDYDFLRSYIRTLRLTFPQVGLLARTKARSFDGINSNFVVVASDAPLEPVDSMLSPEHLEAFMRSRDSVVLTDDHAPVEQLLAPAYR